jgi:hypothetical protein
MNILIGMIRQLIFSLIPAVILSACKTGPELNLPEPQIENGCQLQSAIFDVKNLGNGTSSADTVTYNYDDAARLIRIESRGGWPDINLVYGGNNQIRSTDYAPRLIHQIEYDERGNVKVHIGTRLDYGMDDKTFIYIHEYDKDNHLIQTVFFSEGKYKLKNIYKPDFDDFLAAGMELYNSQSSELEKIRVMLELENISRITYDVDTTSKKMTFSMNSETVIDGKTLDRKEEIRSIHQFDGKKSPKSSRNWRNYTMIREGMDFSELGNLTKRTNTTRNFWNGYGDYAASYEYNDAGYPIKSKSVSSGSETNTTWMYKCE